MMKLALRAKNKLGFVEGKRPCQKTDLRIMRSGKGIMDFELYFEKVG